MLVAYRLSLCAREHGGRNLKAGGRFYRLRSFVCRALHSDYVSIARLPKKRKNGRGILAGHQKNCKHRLIGWILGGQRLVCRLPKKVPVPTSVDGSVLLFCLFLAIARRAQRFAWPAFFCVVSQATCVRDGPSQMRAATRPPIIVDLVLRLLIGRN